MRELGEGENRLIGVWNGGNGWYAKIYEEADLSFHIRITTPDFTTAEEADRMMKVIQTFVLGVPSEM